MGVVFPLALALSLRQPSRCAYAHSWSDYPGHRDRPHPPCRSHPSKRRQIRHHHPHPAVRVCLESQYSPAHDRLRRRDGVLIQDTEQPHLDLTQADLQDSFNAASVRYRIAIGPNQGQKIPRPRANLTRYHGVLAPNAKYRNLVVPSPNRWVKRKCRVAAKPSPPSTKTDSPLAPLSWAERLKRVFKLDIELCPKCGGQLRVIAAITEPDVINKILDHVHQPQAPPRQPPRRVTGSITSEIQFDAL